MTSKHSTDFAPRLLGARGPQAASRSPGFLLGCALLFVAGAGLAAPPVPETCDQADVGERLKCKHMNAVSQQDHLVGIIESSPLSGLLTETQLQGLRNASDRAVGAAARANAQDFKAVAKKRDATCQVQERLGDGDGDDDGVCAPNEDCLEVLGDQIGDDDGVCFPRNGKNKEVCVEICDDEVVTADESNIDQGLASDLEGIYDDVTAQTKEANEVLEQEAATLSTFRSLASSQDSCSIATGGLTRVPFTAFVVVKTLAVTTRGIADIAERGCDQTIFGANGAAVCVAVETVASLAAIAWNAVDEVESTLDSLTVDAILVCAQDTRTDIGLVMNQVGSIGTGIGNVQSDVSALQNSVQTGFAGVQSELGATRAELRALLEETIRLLSTPQGQREEFPAK